MTSDVDFSDPWAVADRAARAVCDRLGIDRADIGLVLGSGWSAGADRLGEPLGSVPLADLPGFSAPVVAGHGGELRAVRTSSGRTAVVLTGRTHLYEGRGVEPVVHGVRTLARLGATTMVLTNGCGGLRREWGPGTVVAIRDHINLSGATPLSGATFIDMSTTWTPRLLDRVHDVDPDLPTGVYAQFHGPQYETPAEVRMAGVLGADLVGMSTVLEAIAARQAGMDLLGLSLVTNHAAGISPEPLDHQEVLAAGQAAAPRLAGLLSRLIVAL
ncbi:purine-nucleoside phosphorylase [Acidipropionibacterium acidipropionici]|uniref:purine-nucleoside phosphorylase n=1 Tax=Acidipropionibacterium acidipropionici TaxID=1748 RepID=UPI00048BB12B|nr:purine-nucleoside phosphorylase [Acidipropionibacterium acidipropionici]ALN15527.1 purine nucleoside phosphorylase [Acidipropionibacterium acidipropionici]APZ08727.1 purine-nucleoside phosphorylase [Acidipropionibacterium acidipropionici]